MNLRYNKYLSRIISVLAFFLVMGAGKAIAQSAPIYWTQFDLSSYSSFGGGSGTEADPYVISSPQHLARLAYLVNNGTDTKNTYFIQRADIDLSGYLWEPIGKNATYTFLGNYDGQGHTISNMLINETYTAGYPVSSGAAPGYGLFGSVNGNTADFATNAPVIENVVLVNPSIILDCAEYNKYTRVGLLVGALGNGSTLQNCNVQGGSINITNHKGLKSSANMFIGGAVGDCAPGFAGYNPNSTPIYIKNISVDADITIEGTNNQGCYQYNAGGIVGRMRYSKGPLVNCYYTGKIDAQQFTVSPSYGAVRNTSASGIANVFEGLFYDDAEKAGMKVYYGDYQVKVNGAYRTPTPHGDGSNIPKDEQSTEMYKAQGLNGCDTYLADPTEVIDLCNKSIQSPVFHWVAKNGKPQLERVDDAEMVVTDNVLSVKFTPVSGATNVKRHWLKRGTGTDVSTADTYTMPEKTIIDIEWLAYVSYDLGGKEYYSNVVSHLQEKNVDVLPSITLDGSRTENTLTLTSTLNQQGLALENIEYHWTKGGVEQSGITTASTDVTAFVSADTEWEVYASYIFNGDKFKTEPAKYTQTVPQATVTATPNGEDIDIQINFDDYGGTITGITYNWDYNIYYADGEKDSHDDPHTSDEVKETIHHESTGNTYRVSAVIFEERLWHVYVNYTYNSTEYVTPYVRYNQAPKAIPTLKVTKVETQPPTSLRWLPHWILTTPALSQPIIGQRTVRSRWAMKPTVPFHTPLILSSGVAGLPSSLMARSIAPTMRPTPTTPHWVISTSMPTNRATNPSSLPSTRRATLPQT